MVRVLRWALCFLGLVTITAPARALVLGNEVTIGSSVPQPSPGKEAAPAIAFDGTNYLVVWEDNRAADQEIWGTRVAPNGSLLDGRGFRIVPASRNPLHPAVAFDGTNFVVVYEQDADANSFQEVYATRVSTAGAVLDANGFAIGSGTNKHQYPTVACGPTNCLVSWWLVNGGMLGRRIAGGAVIEGSPFTVAASAGYARSVYGGGQYFVAWATGTEDIRAVRVSTAGAVLDGTPIDVASGSAAQTNAIVATDGTGYLVAWSEASSGGPKAVWGKRYNAAGASLDSNAITIQASNVNSIAHAATWSGSAYVLLAWRFGIGITSSRVDTTGAVLGAPVTLSATSASSLRPPVAAIAFDGTNALSVWADTAPPRADNIVGKRIAGNGTVVDNAPIMVSAGSSAQSSPVASWNGSTHLVVYKDTQGGIYGVRTTQLGAEVAPPFLVGGSTATTLYDVATAFGGGTHLVAWSEDSSAGRRVLGVRVSPGGSVIDSTPIVLSPAGTVLGPSVSVAYGQNSFLVVWDGTVGQNLVVQGTRVTAGGQVLDPNGINIIAGSSLVTAPRLASNGSGYLLVWKDSRSPAGLFRARLTPSGASLDGVGVSLAAGNNDSPAVASDGVDYLVVWMGSPNVVPNRDIFGARISASGAANALPTISSSPFDGYNYPPAVIFDGSNFVVSWHRGIAVASSTVHARWYNPVGTLLQTTTTIQSGTDPALAASQDGQVIVLYTRFDNGSSRTIRLLGRPARICSVATQGTDCAGGQACVDGVCCASACSGACDACNITMGTCVPVPQGRAGSPACSPYVCGGNAAACPVSCSSPSACAPGFDCIGGVCQPKLANGTLCTTADACASGFCVDGVCCDAACSGGCDACNLPGKVGTCERQPAGFAGAPSCAPFVCDGASATCPSACATALQCPPGLVCNGGQCGLPPLDAGTDGTIATDASGEPIDAPVSSARDGGDDPVVVDPGAGSCGCGLSPSHPAGALAWALGALGLVVRRRRYP